MRCGILCGRVKTDVILPAGGTLKPEFAQRVGVGNKALIEIGSKTILGRTFDALEALDHIGRVTLVADDEVRSHSDGKRADAFLASGPSGPGNILAALRHLSESPNPPDEVLIVTTDLPFVSGHALHDFQMRCGGAELHVPINTRQEFESAFAGIENTYIKLKDGEWTAGCAYIVQTAAFDRALPHIERAFQNRKSPIGMAKLLGPWFLAKFLTKRLGVPEVLGKIETIIDCRGKAIRGASPELAFDIDDLEDYEFAVTEFARRDG